MVPNKKTGGFTLIELMVVIVIIGVLATLAVPRFTNVSVKAKVAEAPRVLMSLNSELTAAGVEMSSTDFATEMCGLVDLATLTNDSKWWTYSCATNVITATTKPGLATGENIKVTFANNNGVVTVTRDCSGAATLAKHIPNFCK